MEMYTLVYFVVSTLSELLSGLGDIYIVSDISLNSQNRVTYGDIVSNQFHVPARIIHHLAVSVVDSSGSV